MKCLKCGHLEDTNFKGRDDIKVIGYCRLKEKLIECRQIKATINTEYMYKKVDMRQFDYPDGCKGFIKKVVGKNGLIRLPDWLHRWVDKLWEVED
jgi:hypothetical protein